MNFYQFSIPISTLSSGLNSVPIVIVEDLIRPFKPGMNSSTAVKLNKTVTLIFSCVCFCLVFLAAEVKTILEVLLT